VPERVRVQTMPVAENPVGIISHQPVNGARSDGELAVPVPDVTRVRCPASVAVNSGLSAANPQVVRSIYRSHV
jgi:hypothetical protein